MMTLTRSCLPSDSPANKMPLKHKFLDENDNEADLADKGINGLEEIPNISEYFLKFILMPENKRALVAFYFHAFMFSTHPYMELECNLYGNCMQLIWKFASLTLIWSLFTQLNMSFYTHLQSMPFYIYFLLKFTNFCLLIFSVFA